MSRGEIKHAYGQGIFTASLNCDAISRITPMTGTCTTITRGGITRSRIITIIQAVVRNIIIMTIPAANAGIIPSWNRYPSHYPSSGYSPNYSSSPSATHAKPKKADAATVKRDTRSTGGKTYLHRVSGISESNANQKASSGCRYRTHRPYATPAPLPTPQTVYQAEPSPRCSPGQPPRHPSSPG